MKLQPRDLEDLLSKAGRVRDVSFVHDRITKRFRGLAYVEFYEEESVEKALELSGTVLRGVPVVIEITETEKNRIAKETSTSVNPKPQSHNNELDAASKTKSYYDTEDPSSFSSRKKQGKTKVVITNISKDTSESDLRRIVRTVGSEMKVTIDSPYESATLIFSRYSEAQEAIRRLAGIELLGRKIFANIQPDEDGSRQGPLDLDVIDELDDEEQILRAKRTKVLAEMCSTRAVCLLQMYFPSKESGPRWKDEIEEEVRLEAQKMGTIEQIYVPGTSDGAVYILFKTPEAASKVSATFSGRWFGGMQISANIITVGEFNLKCPHLV
jgi:RNA-binding protein 39